MNEKKLKVLMINTVPMIYDGITMTILNYAINMDKEELQIDFVANNSVENSIRKTIEEMGSSLFEIHNRNKKQLSYILRLAKLIRKNKYDIVHAHGNSCTLAVEMVAAWLGGAKVRCPHSHNTKCAHTKAHKLLRPIFNLFYTHGFACGKQAGKWLYNEKPFVVLNNGTNTEKYKFNQSFRNEYRRKYNLENKIAIGHVAHFTHHKNHTFLIDVFQEVVKENPQYVLVLIGDGKFKNDIIQKVESLNLQQNVIFVGTTLDIPQMLSAMDFMVLPSLYEGLPNVVIEWQASGLPMLVADTVTADCKLTNLVKFVELQQDVWVREIKNIAYQIDRKESSTTAIGCIKEAGYDIQSNAEKLKGLYCKYTKRKSRD